MRDESSLSETSSAKREFFRASTLTFAGRPERGLSPKLVSLHLNFSKRFWTFPTQHRFSPEC